MKKATYIYHIYLIWAYPCQLGYIYIYSLGDTWQDDSLFHYSTWGWHCNSKYGNATKL